MKKRFYLLVVMLCSLFMLPSIVNAATDWGLGAGESTSLPCAATDSTPTVCSEEFVLTSDITLTGLVRWNGADADVTIDLNGHNITTNSGIALVGGPSLTIKDSAGGGYIKSTGDSWGTVFVQEGHLNFESGRITSTVANNVGVVVVKGATTPKANAASVVVGANATIDYEGAGYGYGLTVDKRGTDAAPISSYGVTVDVFGTIDASNTSGYAGLYVNGLNKDKDNSTIVTIGSTAVIIGAGPGIYAAGYATWTFAAGSSVTGVDSALGIKSGKFTINGGTFTATGPDATPTAGWNNGIKPSGAVIQIEAYSGYAGDVDMTINGGTFTSDEGVVFYEYLGNGTATNVTGVEINGGTFEAATGKEVFVLSQEFEEEFDAGFVAGGTFSSDPSDYIKKDLNVTKDVDGNFVIGTTEENPDTNDINLILIILSTLVVALIITLIIKKFKNELVKCY